MLGLRFMSQYYQLLVVTLIRHDETHVHQDVHIAHSSSTSSASSGQATNLLRGWCGWGPAYLLSSVKALHPWQRHCHMQPARTSSMTALF